MLAAPELLHKEAGPARGPAAHTLEAQPHSALLRAGFARELPSA